MAKLNHHISIILLATILGFTYEIHQVFGEQAGWKIILFVLICLALSETIANSLAALLCNSSFIRRIYMGRNWIEGWWYLQSTFPDSTVVAGEDVLGQAFYEGPEDRLNIRTYKITGKNVAGPTDSVSLFATVEDHGARYINEFIYNEGDKSLRGLAIGSFTSTTKWPWPNKYTGRVIIVGRSDSHLQQGTKIDGKALAQFRKSGGKDWIYHFLHAVKDKSQLHATKDKGQQQKDVASSAKS